jgi:hypothetical protein
MKKYFLVFILFVLYFFSNQQIIAYGGCSEYGIMAYEFGNSCKCMSGYAFGKDFMGRTSCISLDQMCKDEYGYNSSSDYLTNKCKCSYGYGFGQDMFGKTQCVSLDSMCRDQLGYGSRYNSLYEKCECGYGDIIKNGKCTNADLFCTTEHGLYSSYNNSSNQCECDGGYTLNDSFQCVKKQNNVYFTLKALDTDNKKAVIKSDYDYSYYLIEYSYGCYDLSFRRYLNNQIVVNLGTDFDLDTWDKIVLQDDNETCDIRYKEKVDSSFSLVDEDDSSDLTLEQLIAINEYNKKNMAAQVQEKTTVKPTSVTSKVNTNTQVKKIVKTSNTTKVEPKVETVAKVVSPEPIKKVKWYKKIFNWLK